ncbi:MAG: hypothetical protein Q4B79_09135 [Moraxella sp.]|uniref:hypothetical protein n=1 Tax=Moraxella sp. TaxID=479 RepID=UPI0026DB3538|nr:hypothetical protein [Moraxella sp.]MDO4451103.1 hypothetical protein [Moraxella sp.]
MLHSRTTQTPKARRHTPRVHDLLTKIGTYLESGQDKHYDGVNLTQTSSMGHVRVQGLDLGGQFLEAMFGKKTHAIRTLADKYLHDETLPAIADGIYQKIAQLAQAWAVSSLPDNPKSLSVLEREQLATTIARQNRALATLGGTLGGLGLKGVVMDTAWLLVVSLRTVYQLSFVYDVPLTGRQGVSMAYDVLLGANLTKTQEKQVLLTALALSNTLLKNARQGNLNDELFKLSSTNVAFNDFKKFLKLLHLDEMLTRHHLDIGSRKLRWLQAGTSLGAVFVGVHYNRGLIDEVIGTAMATFKPKTALGIDYRHETSSAI